jgi:hypothetical protein
MTVLPVTNSVMGGELVWLGCHAHFKNLIKNSIYVTVVVHTRQFVVGIHFEKPVSPILA